MAKSGFDVWMPNSRGNNFSRLHKYLDPDHNPEYWDFTFEEMALHDTKAVIQHIEKQTGRTKIPCIGLSQGAALFFYGLAMDHEWFKEHVSIYISMCPVVMPSSDTSPGLRWLMNNSDKLDKF